MAGLEVEKSALVLIDIQERLIAAMAESDQERLLKVATQLLVGADALGVPVVITEQYPKGLGHTIDALSALAPSAKILEKLDFDATAVAGVRDAIGDRSQVVVCGLEAHICVFQTVRGLSDLEREVTVVSDACASRNAEHHRLAEGMWSKLGANVSCGESVLFDWLGRAGGDAFKTISRAIR